MAVSSLTILPVQLSLQYLHFDLPAQHLQCLTHCTFTLPYSLLITPYRHARHPRNRCVSVAQQHQRFGSHQMKSRTDDLTVTRTQPFLLSFASNRMKEDLS